MTIERSSLLPLYAQVREHLEREIRSDMQPGDLLPGEPELQRRFGVSRITVRRALDELVHAGLVVRERGRGTFVREPQITQELTRLMSWTVAMRELGHEPRTLRCDIDEVVPAAAIGELLGVGSQKVVRVRRVRAAGDEPAASMTNYLPADLGAGILQDGLFEGSLYATLAARGVFPASAMDRVEARTATAQEARDLAMKRGDVVLQLTRTSLDAADKALYVAVVVNRARNYSYSVRVDGRGYGTPRI
jgi:GntR family transcriptional regulator